MPSSATDPCRRGPWAGPRSQRGTGLIIVIALLCLILLPAALFSAAASRTELKLAQNERAAAQALAQAEAGLNHAVALLKVDADGFNDELNGGGSTGGTGGTLTAIGSPSADVLVAGLKHRHVALGAGPGDGYYVRIDDNHDESGADNAAADVDGIVLISSTGRFAGAERTVRMQYGRARPVGLFGRIDAVLSGGSTTDSYAGGAYATPGHSGNVSSNAIVNASGAGTTIDGDASAGTSVLTSGGAIVTGVSTNAAAAANYPTPAACGPPFSSGTGISGVFSYSNVTGVLSTPIGGAIVLAPGSYCFSNISLSTGTTFTVNGTVMVDLTNGADFSVGQVVNSTHDAANLKITASGGTFNITGGADAYFHLHAPASDVALLGTSPFFGAVVGNRIALSGAAFHVDTTLTQASAASRAWREVRN